MMSREQVAGAVGELYDKSERQIGFVLTVYRVMAHRPRVLLAFVDFYRAIWSDPTID